MKKLGMNENMIQITIWTSLTFPIFCAINIFIISKNCEELL